MAKVCRVARRGSTVPAADDPKGDVLKREIREYGRAVHRKQKKIRGGGG